MATPILTGGATVGADAEGLAGGLTLSGGLTAPNFLMEVGLATDFEGLSMSALAAYVSDSGLVEAGAYVGGDLMATPNVGFGPYGRLYIPVTDKFQLGPFASLDFGYGTTVGRFGVRHNYVTSHCPEGDSTGGIFGNDQGVGGCSNRALGPEEDPELAAEFGFGSTLMLTGWANLTDVLALDFGAGAALGFVPEFAPSFTGFARLVYSFK